MGRELVEQCSVLMQAYLLSEGCPCRFPRFRSIAKRDTGRSLGVSCRGIDQSALIVAFEAHAPLSDRRALGPFSAPLESMWQASCLRCSSRVERSSNEIVPGGWADYLVIRRAPELTELGANVDRLYRCRPLVRLGQGAPNAREAARLYPLIGEDEWFAWLSLRRLET
jgi:hypothetical protein